MQYFKLADERVEVQMVAEHNLQPPSLERLGADFHHSGWTVHGQAAMETDQRRHGHPATSPSGPYGRIELSGARGGLDTGISARA